MGGLPGLVSQNRRVDFEQTIAERPRDERQDRAGKKADEEIHHHSPALQIERAGFSLILLITAANGSFRLAP